MNTICNTASVHLFKISGEWHENYGVKLKLSVVLVTVIRVDEIHMSFSGTVRISIEWKDGTSILMMVMS